MAQMESRRGFLKKLGLLAAGTILGGGMAYSKFGKKDRVEEIYDVIKRTSQSGMSLRPCLDRNRLLRTGFGTVVSSEDIQEMDIFEVPTRGHNTYPYDGNKRELYNQIVSENQSGRDQTYSFSNESIRYHTMKYIRQVEPMIEKFVPNYKKLPVKAQGLLVQTYLKTDGDLASYPVLCQAFNQFSFNVSEKDMALKSAINLYDSNFDLRKINQARMSVLKEVQAEQATLRQKQSAQSR